MTNEQLAVYLSELNHSLSEIVDRLEGAIADDVPIKAYKADYFGRPYYPPLEEIKGFITRLDERVTDLKGN